MNRRETKARDTIIIMTHTIAAHHQYPTSAAPRGGSSSVAAAEARARAPWSAWRGSAAAGAAFHSFLKKAPPLAFLLRRDCAFDHLQHLRARRVDLLRRPEELDDVVLVHHAQATTVESSMRRTTPLRPSR